MARGTGLDQCRNQTQQFKRFRKTTELCETRNLKRIGLRKKGATRCSNTSRSDFPKIVILRRHTHPRAKLTWVSYNHSMFKVQKKTKKQTTEFFNVNQKIKKLSFFPKIQENPRVFDCFFDLLVYLEKFRCLIFRSILNIE